MNATTMIIHGTRILTGVVFVLTGLNGFLNFMPMPEGPERAAAFLGALAQTGYFFPMLKVFELLAGVLLLCNRLVPLAATLLAPIVISIFAYHVFLAPGSMLILAGVLAVCEFIMAFGYRRYFAPLFVAKARVGESPVTAGRTTERSQAGAKA